MAKPRGRFDIVCVFDTGGYLRITSSKDRSLTPTELVSNLRYYAASLESGIRAAERKRKRKAAITASARSSSRPGAAGSGARAPTRP
jgi:hypothetical protein